MGVDFCAILDVSLAWPDLPQAAARLDGVTGELSELWVGYSSRRARWSWEFQPWGYFVSGVPPQDQDEDRECRLHPGLEGPFPFHIVPHRGFAIVEHCARWRSFLQDLAQRERLRRSCNLVARSLGASRLAYLPDLGVEALAEHQLYDEPYERVLLNLQRWWGDASSLALTYPAAGQRYWEQYFVDAL